jgi:hypothetical protein
MKQREGTTAVVERYFTAIAEAIPGFRLPNVADRRRRWMNIAFGRHGSDRGNRGRGNSLILGEHAHRRKRSRGDD